MSSVRRAHWTVAVAVALSTACSGGDTLEEFRSAVEGGASCAELFAQRANFDDPQDLRRIDEELERIDCDSPRARRNTG